MLSQNRNKFLKSFCNQLNFIRNTSKKKRRLLLQNEEEIQEVKFKTPKPTDRRIYAWGLAETGALGVHKNLKKHASKECLFVQFPTRIQFAEQYNVLKVACGYGFSLYITKNTQGTLLFGTGINTDSQLGLQLNKWKHTMDRLIYPAPIQVTNPTTGHEVHVQDIACGRAHSLVLSDSGEVYTLGNNSYGQCGRPVVRDEEYLASSTIHHIPEIGGEKVDKIFCGQDHSLFVTKSGKLFSCGWGADGQTGLEHYEIESQPSEVHGDIKGENVVKVACACDCNLVLNDKGEVFGFGNTEYGQFGLDDVQQVNSAKHLEITKGIGRIVDIASGGSFCLALNENGDVFAWGYGLLGFGPNATQILKPKQIPPTLFGRNDFNPNNRVTAITCGLTHMAAIDEQGDLYMWGKNKYGCLGLGHENDQYFPFKASVNAKVLDVSCGPDHTLALCKSYLS